jgi:tetratricopeptide (TPR) repeat protein
MKNPYLKPIAALALVAALLTACQSAAPGGGRLYDGYGEYHRAITTDSAAAQRWFDQGLQLLYGFNHDEAIRSFREAARLDDRAAMPWWGVAYAYGIHVNNVEMSEEANAGAFEAAQAALARLNDETPVERALIEAVSARYAWPAPAERASLDQAFATAMEGVLKDFPNDPDVGAFFAESLMNLQPWDYWTEDKQPKGRATEIVATIERVLELQPNHPGALHFHIHALEASAEPARAEGSADRLRARVPGSGHLVHMPSHIYVNVGRFEDAASANQRAIAADERYFAKAPAPRFYSIYYLHNIHFLAYAAMMQGRYGVAMESARRIERDIPRDFLREHAKLADGFMATALHVMIRFGKWEEVLAEAEFEDFQLLSRALRHYARTVALANLGRTAEARAELAAFDAAAQAIPADWMLGVNPVATVIPVARGMAEGEIQWREGRKEDAWATLRAAIAQQDALAYDEPPGWMQPLRHALGALLLEGGRAAEAETVFREQLLRTPADPWALLGLEQTLRALGRAADADTLTPLVRSAWSHADIQPPAACYCAIRSQTPVVGNARQ